MSELKKVSPKIKKNRQRWLKALRSGEWEQARLALHEGDKHCCIGVAHCLATGKKKYGYSERGYGPARRFLEYGPKDEKMAITLNDDRHYSFPRIASHFEKLWFPKKASKRALER